MKKGLYFFLGLFVGAVLTLGALISIAALNRENSDIEDGLVLFENPADQIETTSFTVFQVHASNAALVYGDELFTGGLMPNFYFLLGDKNAHYYDGQVIKLSKGEVARQVGTYQYENNGSYRTVAVVKIFKKKKK